MVSFSLGTFEYVAQLLLLMVAFVGLVYKRHVERPRRPINIWVLDITKQGFSGVAGHLCNMAIAYLVASNVGKTSPCSWYFVAYVVDAILGTSLALSFHQMILYILKKTSNQKYASVPSEDRYTPREHRTWREHVLKCGDYGDPPSLYPWCLQMIEWVLVTLLSRLICGIVIYLSEDFLLRDIAREIDSIFDGHPHLLLFTVMVLCPVLMNLAQTWIQDNVLKLRKCFINTTKEIEIQHQIETRV